MKHSRLAMLHVSSIRLLSVSPSVRFVALSLGPPSSRPFAHCTSAGRLSFVLARSGGGSPRAKRACVAGAYAPPQRSRCVSIWRELKPEPCHGGRGVPRHIRHPGRCCEPGSTMPNHCRQVLTKAFVQILPFRIHFLNQLDFPDPLPPFQPLLMGNCFGDIVKLLIPDQPCDVVPCRKTFRMHPVTMFPDAVNWISRYADIKRAVFPRSHDVDDVHLKKLLPVRAGNLNGSRFAWQPG